MNTYKLKLCPNGDWYLANDSLMYPSSFEEKINKLAEEKITGLGFDESIPGLMPGGFINSFTIKKDKLEIFKKKVIPYIGFRQGNSELKQAAQVWDRDEESEMNDI